MNRGDVACRLLHRVDGGHFSTHPDPFDERRDDLYRLCFRDGRLDVGPRSHAIELIVVWATAREVLSLLGSGLSNAEIAARLHVVEGTVKAYVSTTLKQLQARNRVEAAVLASEAGLLPKDRRLS